MYCKSLKIENAKKLLMSTEPKYYQQFEGLEENSINIALKPYYGSLPPKYIDCEQPVLCQIQTGKRSRDTTREPLNIAGVIDRSGSMESDDKLVHCLDSVCTLIENMTDKDLFTLIDYDPKMQFVMINNIFSNGKRLINWYDKVSDLPVFIYYDTGLQTWRWYVRDPYAAKLSKYGFLRSSSFHHDYRKDKYRNKGFWLV